MGRNDSYSAASRPKIGRKALLGIQLSFVYGAIYAGFVAVNVLRPAAMETEVAFGLNLAVFYGLGLIVGAVALALAYDGFCRVVDRAAEAAIPVTAAVAAPAALDADPQGKGV